MDRARGHLADAGGQTGVRVTVNYNPGARAWYVVQTREQDDVVTTLALVKLDDESGEIVKQVGGV